MIWLALLLTQAFAFDPNYPDPTLTPGVTREVTVKELCRVGSTKDARHVTAKMKREVFHRYGFVDGEFKPGDYEIDHFMSLEIGGANDINNLWPQPYKGQWTARMKDVVETNLHRRMCKGQLTLTQIQMIIKSDWIKEYKRIKGIK